MTLAEIKEKLPRVKVKLASGRVVEAALSGRKNTYASVYYPTDPQFVRGFFTQHKWEFSWEAIEQAINNNTSLIV